jgi:hypothetical protein
MKGPPMGDLFHLSALVEVFIFLPDLLKVSKFESIYNFSLYKGF